jgi:hypothetical protein
VPPTAVVVTSIALQPSGGFLMTLAIDGNVAGPLLGLPWTRALAQASCDSAAALASRIAASIGNAQALCQLQPFIAAGYCSGPPSGAPSAAFSTSVASLSTALASACLAPAAPRPSPSSALGAAAPASSAGLSPGTLGGILGGALGGSVGLGLLVFAAFYQRAAAAAAEAAAAAAATKAAAATPASGRRARLDPSGVQLRAVMPTPSVSAGCGWNLAFCSAPTHSHLFCPLTRLPRFALFGGQQFGGADGHVKVQVRPDNAAIYRPINAAIYRMD